MRKSLSARRLDICLCCVLLLPSLPLGHSNAKNPGATGRKWNSGLAEFFDSIDKDGDGQIEPSEALQYIDANFDPTDIPDQDAGRAVQHMSTNLDGNDHGVSISREEVEKHLRSLLKGNRVSEWLKHSVQLPQYVPAFRENSITSLDFPTLVNDHGATLEVDLGVSSKLHRQQMIRALKRVILGLGDVPSKPQNMKCQPLACDSIAVHWQLPERVGQPPMHKYKLERQLVALPDATVAAPAWQTANGDLDDEDVSWVDTNLKVGTYWYRLTAWNVIGWSEYSFSPKCTTANISLPCPVEKCWQGDACQAIPPLSAALLETVNTMVSGDAAAKWKLVCSFGGMAMVGLLVFVRFMSNEQHQKLREILQSKLLQRIARAVGLTQLAHALVGSRRASESGTPVQDGHDVDPPGLEGFRTQSNRSNFSRDHSRGDLRSFSHSDSGNSYGYVPRDGMGSGGSSPKRRSALSHNNQFTPSELQSSSGALADGIDGNGNGTPSLSMRVPTRKEIATLGSEQEVLWLNEHGVEVSINEPGLDIPASPQVAHRHTCSFPGCERSLHPIFNPRAAMTSHYCSICQNVSCQRHTSYSPHGKLGSCGMESKCICEACYVELPRQTQERLERTNKLPRSKKDLAPTGSSGSLSGKDGAQKSEKSRRNSLLRMTGSRPIGSPGEGPSPARSSQASPSSRVPPPQDGLRATVSGTTEAADSATNRGWKVLRTAWLAVMRFQGAGAERRRRTEEELQLQPSGQQHRKYTQSGRERT